MPAQNIKEFPLTFEGGLVTEVEESTLDIGQAATLVNWEPTAQGGLRARNAWTAISTNGLPTNYKVRGWGTIATGTGGGSGLATPAVVQSNDRQGVLGPTETISLAGVTIGNMLVGIVGDLTDNNYTVSGWTEIPLAFTGAGGSDWCRMFYKVATSTSESLDVTAATQIENIAIYELSGVVTTGATDTDDAFDSTSALKTLTCTSAVSSGVAIGFYGDDGGSPYTDEPFEVADGWTRIAFDASGNTDNWTIGHKVYSAASVTDDANGQGDTNAFYAMAIFDAITSSTPATAVEYYIVMAVATSTGYALYRILRDEITTGTWTPIDSATATDTTPFVSMVQGSGYLAWSSSTMTIPRKVLISGPTGSDITGMSGKAGRALAYHKDRLFTAGDTTNPSRLYFSAIGDPNSFTTATDYLDIGGDDGEAIQDLVSVEGLLLVCKTSRLYLISGSGIESFFINELSGGSAAAGRCAVRTPYGTIVVGPTDIWVVEGGGVEPLSRPLGAAFSITGSVSTAYAQDHVLVLDTATNVVHRVNLVTGAWQQETVSDGENEPHHLFSLQGRLYYGVGDSATEVGGTRRLSDPRTYDAVTAGTSFEASTGKMALLGPSVKYTPRRLHLQVRNHDTDHPNALHVTVRSDLGTEVWGDMIPEEVKSYRVDLGTHRSASWLQVIFEADSSAIAGALDIEKMVLTTFIDPVR